VSDAGVAPPQQRLTDIEAARPIGRVLLNAARTLGIEHDRNTRIEAFCERIIRAAQDGRLDPESYALAWMMNRQHRPLQL